MACFALLTSPALAADKPKANTLTPKEIAEGWIMLFDGETTFGWKIDGEAEVKGGQVVLGKGKKTIGYVTTCLAEYADMSFEVFGACRASALKSSTFQPPENVWARYRFTKEPTKNTFRSEAGTVFMGGERPAAPEGAPLVIETIGKEPVFIRNIKLRPLNTKPLFNGKDLSGWKVTQSDPKRVATKFTVTANGELSAKNGPGDLQTEKQFDDFVLQLECKTNGKALNSGLFFRCMPDAYQNGYEAQIQNAYLGDDRTKPLDFGTGAIYRRVKARKVVSNDNEWFTMTVAARGPHIATWVNGYQTVDWTDDRKPNDNPRQGLRTAKGHLSIQGHDPTTDLLFRNIRIAELPK
jgi:hypothetical protein